MAAINWHDSPVSSANRIVLTQEQLQIPGIRSFGWQRDISANSPLQDHFHEDALELTFIVNGSYTFCLGDANYHLNGGELFIAYPNEIHSTNQLPMPVGEIYWLQLNVTSIKNFLFLSPSAAKSLLERFSRSKSHVMTKCKKEIISMLKNAFSCAKSGDTDSRCLCASFLVLILNLLCSDAQIRLPSQTPDIEAALHYIHSNIKEGLLLEDIANTAGLSLSQFKQKFRKQIGTSPRDYINTKKIEAAKQLLLNEKSVTAVAAELSFSTSSYFTAVFKKYTAITPSEFLSTACSPH